MKLEESVEQGKKFVYPVEKAEEVPATPPPGPSMKTTFRTALKEAGWIFILSRVVIIILTYLGVTILPENRTLHTTNCFTNTRACLVSWMHYDVFSYIDISMHGYVNAKATAFFPLFPLLLRFPGVLLGGSVADYYVAGIILSNIFFFFALIVLYLLVEDRFDTSIARTTLFYTAFAPYALFFFIGYTEALFLLLSVMTFFFLNRAMQKQSLLSWWLAGFCGFLSALSRSQGLLLIIPYLVVYVQHFFLPRTFSTSAWREKILAFAPIVLIPLGLVTYMLYLWKAQGDPFLFSTAERVDWGRSPLTFPLVTIYYVVKALFIPSSLQVLNLLNLVSLFIPILGLTIGWKRIPLHYSLFALLMILFVTIYPQGIYNALTSAPRYLIAVFPTTIIFASIKNTRFEKAYLALSLPIFALNILLFVNHYWVA
jgi:Gpi18-like mannosyltransferase